MDSKRNVVAMWGFLVACLLFPASSTSAHLHGPNTPGSDTNSSTRAAEDMHYHGNRTDTLSRRNMGLHFSSLLMSLYSNSGILKVNDVIRMLRDVGVHLGVDDNHQHQPDHNHHHDQRHRRKRGPGHISRHARDVSKTEHISHGFETSEATHFTENNESNDDMCLGLDNVAMLHGGGIRDPQDMMYLAPVILYQLTHICDDRLPDSADHPSPDQHQHHHHHHHHRHLQRQHETIKTNRNESGGVGSKLHIEKGDRSHGDQIHEHLNVGRSHSNMDHDQRHLNHPSKKVEEKGNHNDRHPGLDEQNGYHDDHGDDKHHNSKGKDTKHSVEHINYDSEEKDTGHHGDHEHNNQSEIKGYHSGHVHHVHKEMETNRSHIHHVSTDKGKRLHGDHIHHVSTDKVKRLHGDHIHHVSTDKDKRLHGDHIHHVSTDKGKRLHGDHIHHVSTDKGKRLHGDHIHHVSTDKDKRLHGDHIHHVSKDKDKRLHGDHVHELPGHLDLDHHEDNTHHHFYQTPIKVWGFSILAVLLISLVGLGSVVIIPIMRSVFYNYVLQFLVAVAVGALTGDALLHLLPHAMSGDVHDNHEETDEDDHHSDHVDYHSNAVWMGLCGMGGVITFFTMERLLRIFMERKAKMKERKAKSVPYPQSPDNAAVDCVVGVKLSAHEDPDYQECEEMMFNVYRERRLPLGACASSLLSIAAVSHPNISASRCEAQPLSEAQSDKGHGHSHLTNELPSSVATIAWMVILGDGIHNFSDGLALGAAFANSITGGISTTIAIFCHELPHEIGDFAVLLQAGMSVKQALVYNCVSSVLCFLGMIFGVALGNVGEASLWIFACIAGTFLYIALVDMLPELCVQPTKGDNPYSILGIQLLGILVGTSIMALIAVYEHSLMKLLDM
ncbi:zinc transporter ZIP10-like [Haliotis rufescens]|uniref:zinc transporter ZIP10-like n=1 Tax=Haliotis rufescens TaxID=6454 RepID=UPI00201F48B4|nr:zinc transporter ZIP10-like [Haliotis rufescens]